MNTEAIPGTTAEPARTSAETPAETPPAELTLAEHEAQYSPEARARAATPAEDDESEVARDAQGRFRRDNATRRSQTHAATDADRPRIRELTRRLREAEEERDALRRPAAVPAGAPTQAAPVAPVARPAPPQAPPAADAPRLQTYIDQLQPHEDYNHAVERHARAMSEWGIQQWVQQQTQQAAARQFAESFQQKVESAKAAYPDYAQVALDAPSAIPQGSLIDRWIWEHKSGAHVLYYFQKNPAEVQRVLQLPLLDQVDTLALLSQRLSSPARGSAGDTGSAVTPSVHPAPRPPNPVRTGPLRGSNEPPGENATLAQHQAYYYPPTRRS